MPKKKIFFDLYLSPASSYFLTTFFLLYFRTKFLKWILQSYFVFPTVLRLWISILWQPPEDAFQSSPSSFLCDFCHLFTTSLFLTPCFPPTSWTIPSQSPSWALFFCLSLKISPLLQPHTTHTHKHTHTQIHTHTQESPVKKDFLSHFSYYSWADYLKRLNILRGELHFL